MKKHYTSPAFLFEALIAEPYVICSSNIVAPGSGDNTVPISDL